MTLSYGLMQGERIRTDPRLNEALINWARVVKMTKRRDCQLHAFFHVVAPLRINQNLGPKMDFNPKSSFYFLGKMITK